MQKRSEMQLNIVNRFDKKTDLQFWLHKTPQERIDAVEFLRTQYYALSGYKTIPKLIYTIQIRTNRK